MGDQIEQKSRNSKIGRIQKLLKLEDVLTKRKELGSKSEQLRSKKKNMGGEILRD